MTRKTFETGNGFCMLAVANEKLEQEDLTRLAADAILLQSPTLTSYGLAANAHCQVNQMRFINCEISGNDFTAILAMPNLIKIEFVKTTIRYPIATRLCSDALALSPTLELRFETAGEATELLIDPFEFYRRLQNWRQHWWLQQNSETPNHCIPAVLAYQQAVNASATLQLRFFALMLQHSHLENAMLALPAWQQWRYDLNAHLTLLKKSLADLHTDAYSQALKQLYIDLHADLILFLPPHLNASATYSYYVLLDHYRNLRFYIIELSNTVMQGHTPTFPLRPFKYLISIIENSASWVNETPINWLALAGLTMLFRFFIQLHGGTEPTNLEGNDNILTLLMLLIENRLLNPLPYAPWVNALNYEINLGLFCNFEMLDAAIRITPGERDTKHIFMVLRSLIKSIYYDLDSAESKIIISLLFKKYLLPEHSKSLKHLERYQISLNQILDEHIKKIAITPHKMPLRIPCWRSNQLWLLTHYYDVSVLYVQAITGSALSICKAVDDITTANKDRFSRAYHVQHPKRTRLLRWEQPASLHYKQYQPPSKLRILDQAPGFQERRILFEKVMHYFLCDLEDGEAYFKTLETLQLTSTECYPALVFDSFTPVCNMTTNTWRVQFDNFLNLALAIFALLEVSAFNHFRLPTLGSLPYYSDKELTETLQFIKKTLKICSILQLPTILAHTQTTFDALRNQSHLRRISEIQACSIDAQEKLMTLINQHQARCEEHQKIEWAAYLASTIPQFRQSRVIKIKNHPAQSQTKPSAKPQKTPKVEKKVIELPRGPSYLASYPNLKSIYQLLEKSDYSAALTASKLQINGLSEDSENAPILAYLYYVIADSQRMLNKKRDDRLIFDMQLQGYYFAKKAVTHDDFDSELLSILQILICEVEKSIYFQYSEEQISPKSPPPSVNYYCELTPPIQALLEILFQYFQPDNLFFYGSFVSTALIRQLHPTKPRLMYSDVDIVLFCTDLQEAFKFLSTALPNFVPSDHREGLHQGTFNKVAFDIQILYAHHHNPTNFAASLGLGCRSGLADYTGQCLDLSMEAFHDIQMALTRFLPGTHLLTNPLAILNHIRTQAQYGFVSNPTDDLQIHNGRLALLTTEPSILRDYFSRHFQQGFAQTVLALWHKYQLFSVLLPELATIDYQLFMPFCRQLDEEYQRLHIFKMNTIAWLLASFLQIYVCSLQPTQETLPSIVDDVTLKSTAPLLANLPDVARAAIGDLILHKVNKIGFFSMPSAISTQTIPPLSSSLPPIPTL